MKSCKECGAQISTKASACPKCGAKSTYEVSSQEVGGIVFLLIVCAFFAWNHYFASAPITQHTNSTPPSVPIADQASAPSKPIVEISVSQLKKEYDENEVATDEKYKNITLHVFGRVTEIGKNFADDMVILMAEDGYGFNRAAMTMNDDQKNMLISMRIGDVIGVECEKIARILDEPTGSSCIVLPKYTPKNTNQHDRLDGQVNPPAHSITTESPSVYTPSNHPRPSFKCSKAKTLVEHLICDNEDLSEFDSEMVESYKNLLKTSPSRSNVKETVRIWRENIRDNCRTVECIENAYKDIMSKLRAIN